MNKRKIIVSSVIIAALGTGLVFAGQRHKDGWSGHHRGHHGMGGNHLMHMIDKMEHRLDLSEEQVVQLEQIVQDNMPDRQNMRQQRIAIGERMAALDPASSDYDSSVGLISSEVAEMAKQRTLSIAAAYKQASAILTPEQRIELKQTIQKRIDRMKRRANSKLEKN